MAAGQTDPARKGGGAPPRPRGSTPDRPPTPRFRLGRAWIVFALALLALNFYISSMAGEPASRVRVPYSPFFLNQINAGHVKEITSKGSTIQGTFTEKVKFGKSDPTTTFETEIP